ncbi:hypothetical protein P4H66_12055 [Paenibacillus dokdonensis]|uniref:Lipoprotein n=1 Tax=Paenibacillus dokdonensis TaxID=2567944 RepID=A0ABU6GLJ1_9BACL|nr:hypothetical protein [Paenibacillus dokdonensis]MEC0240588.1 hypothetical protein [Paenibacillus dokdonensis]
MGIARRMGWIPAVALILLIAACSGKPNTTTEPQQTQGNPQEQLQQEQSQQEQTQQEQQQNEKAPDPNDQEGVPPTALEAAATVMTALQNGNMKALASWAHPDKGIRFSPYAYVDTKTDLVFSRNEIEGLMQDSKKRVWGTFPGSGELIEKTFADYYKSFVYDADFKKDGKIALNKGLGQSTMINNLNEVYPKESYDFVEYYIDGITPAMDGMDWRSLRLVFEKIGEDHALVGIIHDQWTP